MIKNYEDFDEKSDSEVDVFGNIDNKGQLENNDILDDDEKENLASIGQFEVNDLLNDMLISSCSSSDDNSMMSINNTNSVDEYVEEYVDEYIDIEYLEDEDYSQESPDAFGSCDISESIDDNNNNVHNNDEIVKLNNTIKIENNDDEDVTENIDTQSSPSSPYSSKEIENLILGNFNSVKKEDDNVDSKNLDNQLLPTLSPSPKEIENLILENSNSVKKEDDNVDSKNVDNQLLLSLSPSSKEIENLILENSNSVKKDDDDDDDASKNLNNQLLSSVSSKEIDNLILENSNSVKKDDDDASKNLNNQLLSSVSSKEIKNLTQEVSKTNDEINLNRPLASMLPSKYENTEINNLFPDFSPAKSLRFLRIFNPDETNSPPNIWRNVARHKRKLQNNNSNIICNQDEKRKIFKSWTLYYDPVPENLDAIASDDETKLLAPAVNNDTTDVKTAVVDDDVKNKKEDNTLWRDGPAKYWYDHFNCSDDKDNFDYGFKLAKDNESDKNTMNNNDDDALPDEAFLMVSQLQWEKNIIWDTNDRMRDKLIKELHRKKNCWEIDANQEPRPVTTSIEVPHHMKTLDRRENYVSTLKKKKKQQQQQQQDDEQILKLQEKMNNEMNETAASTWNSILPFDNDELANNKWEDDIIWDPMNMKEIPKPKILTLDLNDDNIIFNIPEDKGNFKEKDEPKKKVKVTNPHMKKTQMLLGEAGFIPQVQEEIIPKKIENNDPFNISNDIYYMAKQETSIKMNISGGNLMQHSIPVVELRDPFIKTHMSIKNLRNFHRMPLKRLNNCQLSYPGPHKIKPLTLNIIKKAKQREQERIASGGGDVFFMRTPQDLSAKDSKLVLVEYSEQYPPLISQPGMCSKIKNYYKRYPSNDNGPKNYEFGETVYSYKSPFLGSLTPGQTIQTIENNMYRSPIYQHDIPKTDFIIIRTSNQYYIREYDGLFIAGQECPLYEVPAPNSKLANNFVRDFLQVYIYRLFFKSNDIPKKIKMEDIRKAFPGLSESTIRKRLKLCADYQRTGIDSNWWVIRNDFRLPTEDEMREMITPEKCCAYYSMIAGEQRLKDAGYGCEKSLLLPQQDDDDDDIINKKDDEVQAAPWNTTRTYIQSLKGKCLLQLTGPADPTGIGEGFSYIRVPNKPIVNKDQLKESKKQLRGTSSDLRRLDLKKAKEILLQYGLNKKVIDELGRWEIIAVVRTLSTQKAKSGTDDIDIEAVIQFSRGNRHSIAEHHERYKDECQRIFDLQNHILASNEVLSTDDDDDSDSHDNNSDDDDNNNSDNYEEMGKNIENMLNNKKTCLELTKEKEEQARKELMKMINDDNNNNINDTKNNNNNHDKNKNIIKKNKTLKISRTYRDDYGKEYTRTEIISNQKVIDLYLKTRELKDDESIRKIATDNDFQAKEEERRARRRKQEQDRRKRKNEAKCAAAAAAFANKSVLNIYNRNDKTIFNNHDDDGGDGDSLNCTNKKLQLKTDSKFKCGACGSVGHMRTNRACPYFNKSSMSIIDNQENDNNNYQKNNHYEDKDLINVEGIKIKFSSTVIKMANEHNAELMKRKSQSFKHLKNSNDGKKRKRQDDNDDDYYYDNKKISNKRINRRRTNPVVVMTTIFENILQNIQKLSYVTPFILPVTIRQAPDYHIKIMKPMDLQKIRDKLRQTKYKHRKEFLDDFIQIYENSKIYNGENHELTIAAQKMMELCADKIIEEEEKLMILEREINPFVDDNDETKLAFIFKKILNTTIKLMPEVFPFNKPVNKKQYKEYYNIVKRPMDLEKIFTQIDNHMYPNRHVFLQDIKQILYNCELYNGKKHPLVAIANKLYTGCKNLLDQYDGCNNNQLSELENKNSTNHCQENNSLNLQFVPDDINYTIAEPETRISQTNISLNQLCDSSINDDIFVDVEGDVEVDVVGEEVIQAKEEKQIKEEMIKFENNEDNNIVVDDTDDMKTIDILKEDLKSSSEDDNDDDDFEEVPFDANKNSYDLNEFDKFINAPQVPVGDDDHSQQSTQSIDISYFNQQQITQQEEVMDVDLNYDQTQYHSTEVSPEQDNINSDTIHDDLAVSDSDEEHDKHNTSQPGAIWF